mgnify:CR=1 FL=1
MQQIGESILSVYLSNFENVINRKDLVIKTLLSKLERTEQELKEVKHTVKGISQFMERLSN